MRAKYKMSEVGWIHSTGGDMHSHECNGYIHSPNCSKYADGTRGIVSTVIRFKFNCFFRHRACYANIVRMNCARNITIQIVVSLRYT